MDTSVNRVAVGAFVLVLTSAGVAALLWIAAGRHTRKTYDTYLAFFSESVAGLNRRAPVKLRGVEIGAVREVAIDAADPGRVRVLLAIERGTPVKEDTYAVLQSQGLTGIASIELGGGSRSAAPLHARPGEAFPTIETHPSALAHLDEAAASVVGDVGRVATSLNEMLDPETRRAFRTMIRNAARTSAELPPVVARLGRGAGAVERMGNELAETGIAARAAVQEARGAIRQVGEGAGRLDAEVVPDVRRLVADLRDASASLARVTAELERNPSALVAGRAERAPGPGE